MSVREAIISPRLHSCICIVCKLRSDSELSAVPCATATDSIRWKTRRHKNANVNLFRDMPTKDKHRTHTAANQIVLNFIFDANNNGMPRNYLLSHPNFAFRSECERIFVDTSAQRFNAPARQNTHCLCMCHCVNGRRMHYIRLAECLSWLNSIENGRRCE